MNVKCSTWGHKRGEGTPGGLADGRICFSMVAGPHTSLTDGYTRLLYVTMLNLQLNDPSASSTNQRVHKLCTVLKSSLAGCACIQQRRPCEGIYGKQNPHVWPSKFIRKALNTTNIFFSLSFTPQTSVICIVMQKQVEQRGTKKT